MFLSRRFIVDAHELQHLYFFAIMPYVWSEFLILLYHCNFQARSCRLICDLPTLLAFIRLRCETALAPISLIFLFKF